MDLLRHSKVTITIVAVNIVVFCVSLIIAGTLEEPLFSLSLFHQGALFNPLALGAEPWRIFTAIFLHGGIMHLAFNQYALFSIGTGWERHVGWKKWLAVYLVCGVAASLTSLWWRLFSVGVGASGAIFGLFGFVIVESWRLNKAYNISNRGLIVNFAVFLGINLVLAELVHADNSAHFGGLICGIALSGLRKLFHPRSFAPEAILTGLCLIVYLILPRTQVHYYQAFQKVLAIEDSVRYLEDRNLSDPDMVKGLKKINQEWDSASNQIKIIKPMIGDLADDTLAIQLYIRNKRDINAYYISMVERESYIYLDSIEILQRQSDSIPKIKYPLDFRITDRSLSLHESKKSKQNRYNQATIFYDSNWVETPFRPFEFYRVGQRDSLGRWQGPVRDYYKNDQVQMKGSYLDDLHHGVFIYYSRHNNYEAAGRFDRDLRVGKWELFHNNGKLEREVVYGEHEYVRNVWDSTGHQLITNGYGNFESKWPNGVIKETGEYNDGLKSGMWKGYHENGKPYFEEFFSKGDLVRGRSINLSGKIFQYDESSMLALPNGGLKAFQEYVRKTSQLFKAKRPGIVKLYFRVTTDSRITDIIIQRSLDAEADGWAKDILLKGPTWNPAHIHGQEATDGFGFMTVGFEEE